MIRVQLSNEFHQFPGKFRQDDFPVRADSDIQFQWRLQYFSPIFAGSEESGTFPSKYSLSYS